MQTFLPYPDFEKSARVLDNRRLGKQRVEAFQILQVLLSGNKKRAWRNHPAVLMWKGYERALLLYMGCMMDEWHRRGFRNLKMNDNYAQMRKKLRIVDAPWVWPPEWLGDERLHRSHRSNLKRKDPKHYRQFKERDDMPYYWPVRKGVTNGVGISR